MVRFNCAQCQHTLTSEAADASVQLLCPNCGQANLLHAVPDEQATLPPTVELVRPTPADDQATLAPAPAAPLSGTQVLQSPVNGEVPGPSERAVTKVPGYEILAELGRGGMGVVYKARQEKLDRTVALKMILAGGHAGSEDHKRFQTEAQAIARLQHPNIVAVHEVGEHDGKPFFSLEFCPGGSLDSRLDGTPWQPREAARLVQTLARAMHAAHQANVIHRDLKPANVLLTEDGTPKITDFGLAKKLDDQGPAPTQTGVVMGTPSYMAPEQADGKKDIGPPVDIYSLGAILYELLTGRPPFKAATPFDTLLQVVSQEPVPPRQLNVKVPVDVETICLKCLHKEPGRRYAGAEALADDLQRFLSDRSILARRTSTLERFGRWCRRNPVVAGLGVTVAVLLLAVATVSTVSALRLEKALNRTELAEREARLREAEALLGQARGIRSSRRPGQRFHALAALRKATLIGRELDQPPQWFERLRNEAIAALALPDVAITQEWQGFPPGSHTAAVSFDCQLYARTTKQGACSVRTVADDREVASFLELGEPARVDFSPGGLLLLHRANSRKLQLWDLAEPEPSLRMEPPGAVAGWSWRPDGHLLALIRPDGALDFHRTDTGACQHRLPPFLRLPADQLWVSLHPTEPLVLLASYFSNTLRVYDLRTGTAVVALALPWRGSGGCAWSPDGRTLAVSDGDGPRIHLYGVEPARPALTLLRTLEWPAGGKTVLFNRSGDWLVSTNWSGRVTLLDVATGRRLFSTAPMPLLPLRFAPSDQRLAGASVGEQRDRLGVFSVADGREYRVLGEEGWGSSMPDPRVAIHPGGRLAARSLAAGLALYDLETGRQLEVVKLARAASGLCFDEAGNLLSNGFSGLRRWPLRENPARPGQWTLGQPELLPFQLGDSDIAVSADGRVIAQPMYKGYGMERFAGAWILSPKNPKPLWLDRGTSTVRSEVSRDGRWAAFGVHATRVNVYEVATGRRVWQSPADGHVYCRFSPDGRWLVTDSDGGRVYAVGTWEAGVQLGPGMVYDISPDSRLAVLGLPEGILRLVELASGRELLRLEDPDQVNSTATFTPDGTRLVLFRDGIRVWDLRRIRAELVKLGLDWDAPPYPETAGTEAGIRPLEVRVEEARAGAGPFLLKNAGFEAKLDGWDLLVFGVKPSIEVDAQVRHEGKPSLRISATDLTDTTLGQNVQLHPGRRYRLSGWVRTRQLAPQDALVFGTFQVQSPSGPTLASGPNHQGDTDWTRVELPFQAPADGRVRLGCFFVGYGKGKGTAWFAGLRLEEVDGAGEP